MNQFHLQEGRLNTGLRGVGLMNILNFFQNIIVDEAVLKYI